MIVTGLADAVAVSQTETADPRFVAVEDGGLVAATERNVDVLLPLPRRIDAITVMTSADGATRQFDVTEMMKQLCADRNETVPVCR